MYAQFFGNYLLSRGIVTKEQLIRAMQEKSSAHIKIGTLAIHAGYMTANEVDRVIILQTHQDKRFGELAVSQGYLTEQQVIERLRAQTPDFLLLGQFLVDDGIFTIEEFQDIIIDYQSESEIDDFSYSDETIDQIHRMIENFFVLTERALSSNEVSFIKLLINNLIRFIGDDYTPVSPSPCKEYPTNFCVSQQLIGDFSVRTYIDMPQDACIEFASRYVGEPFQEFDEYVRSSLNDFLNLHNGIFSVNMSNERSIELELAPPVTETDELLTFEKETYLLPIVYPFGMIHFIFEIYKL